MNRPIASCRRIDHLKALAYDLGFTNEDARQFGKLTKTATWEALLELYSVDNETLDGMLPDGMLPGMLPDGMLPNTTVDSMDAQLGMLPGMLPDGMLPGILPDGMLPKPERHNSTFLDWVDVGQLIALALASVGVFVLAMNLWRQVNPLNLLPPIRVNIQIGAKL